MIVNIESISVVRLNPKINGCSSGKKFSIFGCLSLAVSWRSDLGSDINLKRNRQSVKSNSEQQFCAGG